MKGNSDPEADDEAVAETLRRIRETEAIGATALDLVALIL
jgi:hypothetical protein